MPHPQRPRERVITASNTGHEHVVTLCRGQLSGSPSPCRPRGPLPGRLPLVAATNAVHVGCGDLLLGGGVVMKKSLLLWIAVPLLLLAAAMLIAGIGASALWFAVVTIGICLVVIGGVRRGATGHR